MVSWHRMPRCKQSEVGSNSWHHRRHLPWPPVSEVKPSLTDGCISCWSSLLFLFLSSRVRVVAWALSPNFQEVFEAGNKQRHRGENEQKEVVTSKPQPSLTRGRVPWAGWAVTHSGVGGGGEVHALELELLLRLCEPHGNSILNRFHPQELTTFPRYHTWQGTRSS